MPNVESNFEEPVEGWLLLKRLHPLSLASWSSILKGSCGLSARSKECNPHATKHKVVGPAQHPGTSSLQLAASCCINLYEGLCYGPQRPHKHEDSTNRGFWNPSLSRAEEPECRILVFMWSLGAVCASFVQR